MMAPPLATYVNEKEQRRQSVTTTKRMSFSMIVHEYFSLHPAFTKFDLLKISSSLITMSMNHAHITECRLERIVLSSKFQ